MNREEFFYLLPYVFSLALSLGVFISTWQHRYVRGARLYSWFVGGQTLTILAFIFELVSPNLQTKLLWDKFQWLTDSFLVILPFLLFSVQFSEYKLRYPRAMWGCVLIFPVIFAAFTLTDNLHHLIYPDPHLSTDYPFPELQYKFTIIVVNFPELQLPVLQNAHRLIHIHENVPGILAHINNTLAGHNINIAGQYLKTNDLVGYVITDIAKKYDPSVISDLKNIPPTIKFILLY